MRLFLAALLLISVATYAQQQGKAKGPRSTPGAEQQPPSQPTQILINNASAPYDEGKSNQTKSAPTPESKPFFTHGEAASTILGLLVLVVSILGWLAVRRQAQIMSRSLRLQESGLRQWLVTDEWNVEMGHDNEVTVIFSVLNETPLPLWLEGADIKVPKFEQVSAIGTWLVPKGKYPINAPVKISDERMAAFEEGHLILPVDLSLTFRDSLRNRWEQKSEILLHKFLGGIEVKESKQIVFDSPPDEDKGKKKQ